MLVASATNCSTSSDARLALNGKTFSFRLKR